MYKKHSSFDSFVSYYALVGSIKDQMPYRCKLGAIR